MKFSAVLLALFAGAVMAAPVPDNSIHERGVRLPSASIEERGYKLKKPIVERGRLYREGAIDERGVPLPNTPIRERGLKLKKPIAERGVQLPPGLDVTNPGLGFGEGQE